MSHSDRKITRPALSTPCAAPLRVALWQRQETHTHQRLLLLLSSGLHRIVLHHSALNRKPTTRHTKHPLAWPGAREREAHTLATWRKQMRRQARSS